MLLSRSSFTLKYVQFLLWFPDFFATEILDHIGWKQSKQEYLVLQIIFYLLRDINCPKTWLFLTKSFLKNTWNVSQSDTSNHTITNCHYWEQKILCNFHIENVVFLAFLETIWFQKVSKIDQLTGWPWIVDVKEL